MPTPQDKREVNFFPIGFGGASTIIVSGVFGGPFIYIETEDGWQELRRERHKEGLNPVPMTNNQSEAFHALVKQNLGMDLAKSARAGE